MLIRLSWLTNRQTRLELKLAETRARTFLDEVVLPGQENVLIVSHTGLMMSMSMRKELVRRGFQSPNYTIPDNGKLQVLGKQ